MNKKRVKKAPVEVKSETPQELTGEVLQEAVPATFTNEIETALKEKDADIFVFNEDVLVDVVKESSLVSGEIVVSSQPQMTLEGDKDSYTLTPGFIPPGETFSFTETPPPPEDVIVNPEPTPLTTEDLMDIAYMTPKGVQIMDDMDKDLEECLFDVDTLTPAREELIAAGLPPDYGPKHCDWEMPSKRNRYKNAQSMTAERIKSDYKKLLEKPVN